MAVLTITALLHYPRKKRLEVEFLFTNIALQKAQLRHHLRNTDIAAFLSRFIIVRHFLYRASLIAGMKVIVKYAANRRPLISWFVQSGNDRGNNIMAVVGLP